MSGEGEQAAGMMCCANCGKAEVDDVKLKLCACNLVKYCSVSCQKNHRSQHKKACKKRLAELRDDKLFRQPDESHLGECPICCLPLPLDYMKWAVNSCCCQRICLGCKYANKQREKEQGLEHRCPYCREPIPKTKEEADQRNVKRAEVNDPVAIFYLGSKFLNEGQYDAAVGYFSKAAALGEMMAHHNLSIMYSKGEGVEKDMKMEVYHLEEAAIGGHPMARYNLGRIEQEKGRIDRAYKHWIIAAKLGDDGALKLVKLAYQSGQYRYVNKEDFEAVLRGYQAAVDATKSEQREEAYAKYGI